MKYLYILFILFPLSLSAQISHGFLVKTLLVQDAFRQNPNIIFEKRLSAKISIELLAALRNGDWYMPGGEGPYLFPVVTSNGFTAGLSARYYFSKQQKAPDSWFTSALLRYNNTTIKKAGFQTGIHSEPRIVNLSRSGPEIGIILGRQFLVFNHFTTELYFGGGTYLQFYKEEYISGPENEVIPKQTIFTFRPYLGWTIGYYFGRN